MIKPLASNKSMLFRLRVPNQPMLFFLEFQDNMKSTYQEKKKMCFLVLEKTVKFYNLHEYTHYDEKKTIPLW